MRNYYPILLYLSLLLSPVISLAQQVSQVRTVVVSSKDSTLTFQVLYNSNKVSSNDSLLYYWEHNNVIHCNQGGFTGNLLHGKYKQTNAQGQLVTEGQFCNGTRHAEWKEWDISGDLLLKAIWNNGTLIQESQKKDHETWEQITYKSKDTPSKKIIKKGREIQCFKYINSQWVERKSSFLKRRDK